LKEKTKMKFKSIAGLLALSFIVLTGTPVFAAQIVHPARIIRSARHRRAGSREARRQAVFGTFVGRKPFARNETAPKALEDDWPANSPVGNRVPRADASATRPAPVEACDVGDNPFIC
jgi:hypothetical protein